MQKLVLEMIKDSEWSREMEGGFEFDFLVLLIMREVNTQILFQPRFLAVAFTDVAFQTTIYCDLH